jgi:hypothetical protein
MNKEGHISMLYTPIFTKILLPILLFCAGLISLSTYAGYNELAAIQEQSARNAYSRNKGEYGGRLIELSDLIRDDLLKMKLSSTAKLKLIEKVGLLTKIGRRIQDYGYYSAGMDAQKRSDSAQLKEISKQIKNTIRHASVAGKTKRDRGYVRASLVICLREVFEIGKKVQAMYIPKYLEEPVRPQVAVRAMP